VLAVSVLGSPEAVPAVGGDRTARGLTASTATSLGIRLLGIAIGMATTAVLARTLEPAGYGMLSLAITLGTAAAQTADLGIAVTVAARIARTDRDLAFPPGRVLGTGLAIRSCVALLAAAALVVLALAGRFGDSSSVVAIVALATPLSAAGVLTAGSTARLRPEVASVLALAQGVLWLLAVLVVGRGGIEPLAWCFVAVVLLQTALGVVLNRRVVPLGAPSWTEARRILAVSWPLAVSSLAVTAYYRLDSLILFHARGATDLGYYSAAYKFIDVAQLGPSILVAPLLPLAATSLARDVASRRVLLSLATRTAAVIGTGTAVMLIALASPLIRYLYGDGFVPAATPLALLAVAFVGIALGFVGTTICSALGAVRPVAALTVVVAVLSLGTQAWVCPRWGATGAAAVTAGTELVIGAATCLLAARAMSSSLPLAQLGGVVLIGAAAVVATMVASLPWPVEAALAVTAFAVALLPSRIITAADLNRVLSRRVL
jgi:O-antigen/teichoic acid export membrane protein